MHFSVFFSLCVGGAEGRLVFVLGACPVGYLGLGELGHGLGALGHGVLGEFAGEDEADGGLHIAAGHGGAFVDAAELGCLRGDLLERIGDEIIDDRDTLLGDARLRVHLLHDLEDVAVVRHRAPTAARNRRLRGNLLRHSERVTTQRPDDRN